MQFVRISLLIFALGFFFACSLGTQRYGKLSLSIEVPDYLKTETNEQPSNARFIHPNGDRLEFELYTESRVIHTQTITLNPQPNNPKPQTVPISVDKVPYNVPLFAKITVIGVTSVATGEEGPLGSNDIYIGYLKSGNNKLTLGVKPVEKDLKTATYESGDNGTNLTYTAGDISKVWKIKMLNQKGLYTISGDYNSANIYLYDSDGKNYQNSLFIGGEEGPRTLVFYHPEDKASTYYAYFESQEVAQPWPEGGKLEQDILITIKEDGSFIENILYGNEVYLGMVNSADENNSLVVTIYNPYPFTLNLTNTIENADEFSPDSKDKFTFEGFPISLPPGGRKEFYIIFEPKGIGEFSAEFTIQADGLGDFVLNLTGTGCA